MIKNSSIGENHKQKSNINSGRIEKDWIIIWVISRKRSEPVSRTLIDSGKNLKPTIANKPKYRREPAKMRDLQPAKR